MEPVRKNSPATAADANAPAPGWRPDERRFKVFISYSRGDSADFAQRIVKGLDERGLATKLDTRDLEFGAKWQAQLEDFIRQADAIVFIVSPRSIASEWCRWEVAQVAAQSKRLVPVVHIPVKSKELPPEIREVHLFPFPPGLDFAACADRLAEDLQKDRVWLQEHTRLTELAYTWATEQKSRDHLLRGKALRNAEGWMARRPSDAPPPSQAHLDFIAASALHEARQNEEAAARLQESLRTVSLFRAEQAVRAVNSGDAVTGILLALEGLPDEQAEDELQRTRPYVPESEQALYGALVAQRERAILKGHANFVSAVFSPDGARVVTASSRGTYPRLWDAASGSPLATLKGHRDTVWSAVFSPDGSRVLTASSDNTARLWEAATGRLVAKLEGHQGWVNSAVFSADGTRVLTASKDATARLWEAASGKLLATLRGNAGRVSSAVLSPDGARALTLSRGEIPADTNYTVQLWEAASGRLVATFEHRRSILSPVKSAVFSPDGGRVLTASWDETARLWDAASGSPLVTFEGHEGGVLSAVFSPDGARVLTASSDKTARLWDAASGRLLSTLANHQDRVTSAVFSPDGTRVLTASKDATARLWEAASGEMLGAMAATRTI